MVTLHGHLALHEFHATILWLLLVFLRPVPSASLLGLCSLLYHTSRIANSVCSHHFFQISASPLGTLAATLDVEAAFRTVPVSPEHKPYTVVSFDGGFWLDHVHPFGCASSGGNHGEVADFTMDCWEAQDIGPGAKWVDDFVIFASPSSGSGTADDPFIYPYDLAQVKEAVAPLNIPWHPTKGQDFGQTFDYVGFHWDLEDRVVSLPQEKRLKFKGRVDAFLQKYAGRRAPLEDVETLNGSLSHAAFVYPHGRSYLPSLCQFITDFDDNFQRRYPPHSLLSDLRWWSATLADPDWARPVRPRPPLCDLGIFVDASTSWGIGLIWDNGSMWDAWKLWGAWKSRSRHIGWLEAVAIELAVMSLVERGISNAHILIRSDNQGVIGAWEKGRGKNFEINLSIRRAVWLAHEHNIDLTFSYVESKENLADPISRGLLGPANQQLSSSFSLPEDLLPFLAHAR